MQNEYDGSLNELYSMENDIDRLKRQLDAAACREEELQRSLLSEVQTQEQLAQLQNEHIRVQVENEELRRQAIEINKKEKYKEASLAGVNKLSGKFALHEGRKEKKIANLKH